MGQTTKILAALPTLSKPELAQVQAAATALLGPTATPNDPAATPVFDAITRALGLRLGFAAFQATGTYKTFKRGEQAVDDFINDYFPAVKLRATRQALISFMVECLMDDLKQRGVPLSIGTVCNNLERAPQVFRDGFPNYIEGGASGLILQQMVKGRS